MLSDIHIHILYKEQITLKFIPGFGQIDLPHWFGM